VKEIHFRRPNRRGPAAGWGDMPSPVGAFVRAGAFAPGAAPVLTA
jgi:hypothetical protein